MNSISSFPASFSWQLKQRPLQHHGSHHSGTAAAFVHEHCQWVRSSGYHSRPYHRRCYCWWRRLEMVFLDQPSCGRCALCCHSLVLPQSSHATIRDDQQGQFKQDSSAKDSQAGPIRRVRHHCKSDLLAPRSPMGLDHHI